MATVTLCKPDRIQKEVRCVGDNVKVKADGLGNAIRDALEETKKLTEDALIASIDKTAKETVQKVKSASPTKTGKYAKGWTSKVTTQAGRGRYGRTVYNKPRYMLVHLLQNGHGGPRPARPHPHIPPDEETEALFEKNLESEINKG